MWSTISDEEKATGKRNERPDVLPGRSTGGVVYIPWLLVLVPSGAAGMGRPRLRGQMSARGSAAYMWIAWAYFWYCGPSLFDGQLFEDDAPWYLSYSFGAFGIIFFGFLL
ncbi:hypothetical protein E3N88_10596 [Mikania micrantha]|uniref:Uncharacterized protein n=1 Tax=Mikania micrantha TaxID=192012 RepID=A0A5N6PB74_9ASTR|nr:hypothetical protein E3N88_10596 [Mikania micrantha]